MKLYSDILTSADLVKNAPLGVYIDVERVGTKKRVSAFDVHMVADVGTDAHGIKRRYRTNTGQYGADGFKQAATWIEWGDWIVTLFKLDPDAEIGFYSGWEDFLYQTEAAANHRPTHENAPVHVHRWAKELNDLRALDAAI